MTKNDTKILLAAITGIYPQQPINDVVIKEWNRALASYTYDKARRALDAYIATDAKWPPTPGKLIALMVRDRPASWHTMTLDDRGHVRWQPEPGGRVFDIPIEYDPRRDVYVDRVNGYEFAAM